LLFGGMLASCRVVGLGACCWGSGVSRCVVAWCGDAVSAVVVGVVLVRVVVENCIVDASILFFVWLVLCKLCSAIGGCLGTKSR